MPRPPDPKVAARAEEIITLAIRGESPARIARALGLARHDVYNTIKHAVERLRRDNQKRVALRWFQQDRICADLVARWHRQLRQGFDRDIAGALIKVMERQARLLGIDTERGLDTDKWLAEASDEQLRDELRRVYGIEVPDALMRPSAADA